MIQNKRCPIFLRVKLKHVELLFLGKLDLIKMSNEYKEINNYILNVSEFNLTQIYRIIEKTQEIITESSVIKNSANNNQANSGKGAYN